MINKTKEEIVEFIIKFTRDDRKLNKLLRDQENKPEMVAMCIELFLDGFNNVIPYSSFTLETIETFPSLKLLIDGTIIELLTSAGILYSRNSLPYSDGGISVEINPQGREYKSWLEFFYRNVTQRVIFLKRKQHTSSMFRRVSSPYRTSLFR